MSVSGLVAGRATVILQIRDLMTQKLSKMESRLGSFASKVGAMGQQMALVSAAVGLPLVRATQSFIKFEDAMLTVRAISSSTARMSDQEFGKFSDTILKLASGSTFMADEFGEAAVAMRRSGIAIEEIPAALESTQLFARATGAELKQAFQIVDDARVQFGLGLADTAKVADILAAASNNAKFDIFELSESMTFAGEMANRMNLTLEETVALQASLAAIGRRGSLAGRATRSALTELLKPGKLKILTDFMNSRGLSLDLMSGSGALRNPVELLREMHEQLQNVSEFERNAILQDVVGTVGGSIGALFGEENLAAVFDEILEKTQNAQGEVKTMAEIMESGAGGAMRRMGAAWDVVNAKIGKAVAIMINRVEPVVTTILNLIVQAAPYLEPLVQLWAGIAAAMAVASVAMLALASGAVMLRVVMFGLGPIISVAFSSFVFMAKAALSAIISIGGFLMTVPGLVLIAMGAIMGVFLWLTGGLEQIFNSIASGWNHTTTTMFTAWHGFVDAISAGNFELAFHIAVLGIQATWARAWGSMKDIVDTFVTEFVVMFIEGSRKVIQVIEGLAFGIASAINAFLDVADSAGKMAGMSGIEMRLDIDAIRDFDDEAMSVFDGWVEARRRARDVRREAREGEISQLEHELGVLTDEARRQRFTPPEAGDEWQASVRENLDLAQESTASLGEVLAGTFSGFAASFLALMPTTSIDEKQLSVMQSIDEGVDDMNDKLDNAEGLVMG